MAEVGTYLLNDNGFRKAMLVFVASMVFVLGVGVVEIKSIQADLSELYKEHEYSQKTLRNDIMRDVQALLQDQRDHNDLRTSPRTEVDLQLKNMSETITDLKDRMIRIETLLLQRQ